MLRRGCTLIAVLYGVLGAAYFWFFNRYFEWPGNLIAAGFGSLFGGLGISSIGHVLWAWRDMRAFARARRREPPADGELVVAAGPIRPLGAPLTSPFSGRPCVAYDYEVFWVRRGPRGRTASRSVDVAGFAMAASTIDTPHGGVRLLGFPLLDEFPQDGGAPGARARAEQYVATTQFDSAKGIAALKVFSEFDDALADADGMVRKDFRMSEGEIPFDRRTLGERVVIVGQQVCAVGRYDAAARALVPRGATLNRLWPGSLDDVRRKMISRARTQVLTGLVFFGVTHAMLGVAFYMSETRHAREPEDRQASVIRQAVQDNDLTALERAVRRGANPNARDAFGDIVLVDVRDPAMAAALIRLGADVNGRAREGGDTLLIRAARMGNLALLNVLLAAGANVHVANADGATALGEATREGHEDVSVLLRNAGASAEPVPVEGPRTSEPTRRR